MLQQKYTSTIQSLAHLPATMKDQTIAAYETLSEAEQEIYIKTLTELDAGFATFDAEEQAVVEEMADLIRTTERTMITLERKEKEDQDHAADMTSAEQALR